MLNNRRCRHARVPDGWGRDAPSKSNSVSSQCPDSVHMAPAEGEKNVPALGGGICLNLIGRPGARAPFFGICRGLIENGTAAKIVRVELARTDINGPAPHA